MLLVVDVGNTHVVFGLFREEKLLGKWRLQSNKSRTVDEYALELLSLFNSKGFTAEQIDSIAVSCVVPVLSRVFVKISRKYFSKEPLLVDSRLPLGLKLLVDVPETVGADRIVNAVAAKKLYGSPVIVVDFGTATTFDVINSDGNYIGGIISPGLLISAEVLSSRAAKLPSIELCKPAMLIGKNTRDSMLSGIVFGYVELVDGIIRRIEEDTGVSSVVIATGGLANLIAPQSRYIKEVVPELTLQGLRFISSICKGNV